MSRNGYSDAALVYMREHGILPALAKRVGVREEPGALVWPTDDADGQPAPRRLTLNGTGPKVRGEAGRSLGVWWPGGRPKRAESVLVCEGESDALAALSTLVSSEEDTDGSVSFLRGLIGGVLSLPGTGFPPERLVEGLSSVGAGFVALALDADEAGRRAARSAMEAVRAAGMQVVVLNLPDGRDLGDCVAATDRPASWLANMIADANAAADEQPEAAAEDVAAGASVTAAEFIAAPRELAHPYVSTTDGRTVLLARGGTLLPAGSSGVGKSLVTTDLVGRLASPQPSEWLSLRVCGGLRVLLVPYEGEGSDEDVADRLAALVPVAARDSFFVWDRWRQGLAPKADAAGVRALAAEARRREVDVVALDTGPSFFSGAWDVSKGIPEDANAALEDVRTMAGRPLAFVLPVHTRKRDTRAATTLDELEEVAGTFAKKADAALVIRRDGEDRGPRRRVVFAKCRRGPEPDTVIATFPGRDDDAPPRLSVVAGLGGVKIKEGTDADAIAKWMRGQGEPVAAAAVRARFNVSETTLRNRRDAMRQRGIEHHRLPGRGNSYGYGTREQWATVLGIHPDEQAEEAA